MVKFGGYDFVEGGVCAPKGFKASGIHAGIRNNKDKKDLALIYADKPCTAAAMYTQNKVCGSPIVVTKKHLANSVAQAVICNSGNANTCNADGEQKAEDMAKLCAAQLKINQEDVIVASTGVIGQVLPIEPIIYSMNYLCESLSENGSTDAAHAIMTTDTKVKQHAIRFKIGDKECTVAGIAKGSGMIHPNMATMLCFLTTDVAINATLLQRALKLVVEDTFNMVSVDGDTSTNDMVSIMASGYADNDLINEEDYNYEVFANALYILLMNLSREIAADGEGATKLLECVVSGAKTKKDAKTVAKSVITSSLFKAAMFGKDANWGRILCAVGYSDAELDINGVSVSLSSTAGTVKVCECGAGIEFSEDEAFKVLSEDEIKIVIELSDGEENAVAWGCDLTYDYVKINGDYRT